ncbi:MAG TPA: ABC-2 family transporter protein [Mobilitalea sp.]|nr:ABC-2 family transporter protein [Mobilitalea sp.]
MKKICRYARLYRVFVSQFLKKLMQSEMDFFAGLIGFFIRQLAGIAFLYLVFEQIPDLKGWSFQQLVFIYGFAQIPKGLDHLFTDNIWLLAWRLVVNGEFDRYMLRPVNILFQLVSEKLQPDALGELTVGIILVIQGVTKGVAVATPFHVLLFLISVVAGVVIYTSIKLFFASFSFWFKIGGPSFRLHMNYPNLQNIHRKSMQELFVL